MRSKTCFKCNSLKPLSDFYKHSKMQDGHLNKCKTCTKEDVAKNRIENLETIREYDRNRPNKVERNGYNQRYSKEYRERFPNKYAAHILVNNYLRDGKLTKGVCEVCESTNTVAHHDDYSKPLEVRWLCQAHHVQWHVANGEGLNG